MCFCFIESVFFFCHLRYRHCLHCDYYQKHRLCFFLEISCYPFHSSTNSFHHGWYGYYQTSGLALFRTCHWNECFHCNNVLLFQIFTPCFNIRRHIQFVCFKCFHSFCFFHNRFWFHRQAAVFLLVSFVTIAVLTGLELFESFSDNFNRTACVDIILTIFTFAQCVLSFLFCVFVRKLSRFVSIIHQ